MAAARLAQRNLDAAAADLAQRSVAVLHLQEPEKDFRRWDAAVREIVASYGPSWITALPRLIWYELRCVNRTCKEV